MVNQDVKGNGLPPNRPTVSGPAAGGLRPKKALGQHFLHDQRVLDRIAGLVMPNPNERVLEIGPGEGALTDKLVAKGMPLTAVEVDREAIAYLRQRFASDQVTVLEQDVLNYALHPGHWTVVGNLPYNVSSPILFWVLDHRQQVQQAVFMVQLEVAQRIAASPGSKTYGILSVLLGLFYDIKLAFRVAPGAFRPPPNVQSAVFTLQQRQTLPNVDFPSLKTVVKTAFGQRRKTLRNALKSLELRLPEAIAGLRAEALPPEAYLALADQLASQRFP